MWIDNIMRSGSSPEVAASAKNRTAIPTPADPQPKDSTSTAKTSANVDRYEPSASTPAREEIGYIPPQKTASYVVNRSMTYGAYTHYADGEKIDLSKKYEPPKRMEGESYEDYEKRALDKSRRHSALYFEKVNSGTLTAKEAAAFSGTAHLKLMSEPVQYEGESDEDFARRKITTDTQNSWVTNLKQWLDHIEGWRMGESARYLDEKSTEWATNLMKDSPAMFREWLESEKWNVDEGRIDVCVLPKGFTEADFNKWMEKDVLDYL